MSLPIDTVIPNIVNEMTNHDSLVIQAPPGAGKTTVVPLSLLTANSINGRILLIQPRRLAVYGAAHRMASQINQPVGQTVGYTTRFDNQTSSATRIEVITEGIFLRKIQNDPELTGVGLVIFDEFHERSVTNDLGLAFALETQQGYRDADNPLKIIVMSATLDGDQLSNWLDAPLVKSEGRSFPVETIYKPSPTNRNPTLHIAQIIQHAAQNDEGSMLVFLPGMKEINRVIDALKEEKLPEEFSIFPLHASLPQEKQQQAIAAPKSGERKIVLTTNVSETSVTIEGIQVVIDSGQVRVSRYDERRSMNVLVTEKVSAASTEQRRGRAGRICEGTCYRLWSEAEQRQLKPFSEAEILRTDLLPIALELSIWGCADPNDLMLLTQPNQQALQRSLKTLNEMGAINQQGNISTKGNKLAQMGLHPRLASLIINNEQTEQLAAAIATAAILSEGDPLRFHQQWPQSDLAIRLHLWESTKTIGELHKGTWQRIKKLCRQLAKRARYTWKDQPLDFEELAGSLAKAFPEHIAQLRKNSSNRYLLANGKGVQLNPEDNLANTPYLVVLDASGNEKEPFIRLAFELSEFQLRTCLQEHLVEKLAVTWNEKKNAVEATQQLQFEALTIEESPVNNPDQTAIEECLLNTIAKKGLSALDWNDEVINFQQKVNWLHSQSPDKWPNWEDSQLLSNIHEWLPPFLVGAKSLQAVKRINMMDVLKSYLSWELSNELEQAAPSSWLLPTGSKRKVTYHVEKGPTLNARMQELYSVAQHPTLPNGTPILIDIRSPADRPIQLTKDLVSFWQGSYKEVAKEMRGRYPKHYWPDDPMNAQATTKTKKFIT